MTKQHVVKLPDGRVAVDIGHPGRRAIFKGEASMTKTGVEMMMEKMGVARTRENYIKMNYDGLDPRSPAYTAEHELELPDDLQDFEQFNRDKAQKGEG